MKEKLKEKMKGIIGGLKKMLLAFVWPTILSIIFVVLILAFPSWVSIVVAILFGIYEFILDIFYITELCEEDMTFKEIVENFPSRCPTLLMHTIFRFVKGFYESLKYGYEYITEKFKYKYYDTSEEEKNDYSFNKSIVQKNEVIEKTNNYSNEKDLTSIYHDLISRINNLDEESKKKLYERMYSDLMNTCNNESHSYEEGPKLTLNK